MPDKQNIVRTNDTFDLQEKFITDQVRRQNEFIVELRRKRRRRVVQRSLSLFFGLVLMLFGVIEVLILHSLETSLGNILIFAASEIFAIPFVIHGLVLFRRMPIDIEITLAAEKLMDLQDSLVQLREERSNPDDSSIAPPEAESPRRVDESEVTTQSSAQSETSSACPECGSEIREGNKVCRNCGHLFV